MFEFPTLKPGNKAKVVSGQYVANVTPNMLKRLIYKPYDPTKYAKKP